MVLTTHMGDLTRISDSWLQAGPAMAVAGIWEVKKCMADLFVPSITLYSK